MNDNSEAYNLGQILRLLHLAPVTFRPGLPYSENRIIVQSGLFENEIGPGMLKSSVQKTCVQQERQRHKAGATEYVSILSFFSGILAEKKHITFFKRHTLFIQQKSVYKNHRFSLSGWQRFLNYGHLTKYFGQSVGRGRGN